MNYRVHPLAWWGWALGIAIAISRAPGLAETVVLACSLIAVPLLLRTSSPFAKAFNLYLVLAASIVFVRILFYVLVGIKGSGNVILAFPRIPLPEWAGGIQILGPVTDTGLLIAFTSGLNLGCLLLCFGAAISLTDPRRTLRNLPSSLYLVGTSSVIALTLGPQLLESWRRVRRAQSLRGQIQTRRQAIKRTLAPVLQDALERSIAIAASMDSRGYARLRSGTSPVIAAILLSALFAAGLGSYTLLAGAKPAWLAVLLLVTALVLTVFGTAFASRSSKVTRVSPDRWGAKENAILVSGIAVVALSMAAVWNGANASTFALFLASAIVAVTPIPILLLQGEVARAGGPL